MEYTSRTGDRDTEAHVNYQCPCGCAAGLIFERHEGAQHLGQCCCGRMLWVGTDAEAVVRSRYKDGTVYELDLGRVSLPWGEDEKTALAVPLDVLVSEQAKRDAGQVLVKVTDPVCRMMFEPAAAAATSGYQGTIYHFCAISCKTKFDANPSQYVPVKGFFQRLRGGK